MRTVVSPARRAYLICTLWSLFVIGPLVACGLLFESVNAEAQMTYEAHATAPPAPEGYFSTASPSCTLPSGGFLKKGGNLIVNTSNTSAPVTGYCEWLWAGSHYYTQYRYLSSLWVDTTFASPTWHSWYPPTNNEVSLDTRPNGGYSYTMNTVGAFDFKFYATAFATQCGIPIYSDPPNTRTVNVIACQPTWVKAGSPQVTVHVPATTVYLYVPSNMWNRLVGPNSDGPAIIAADDLSNKVSGTGLTFVVTPNDCGSGGNCIVLSAASIGSSCGTFTPGSFDSNGEITTSSSMNLRTNWSDATDARLERTIVHELEHSGSLGDNSCSVADSVMSPGTSCNSVDSGMTISVTPTDALPTISTYTNQVQSLCGF
jgi:hypothetical protein